MGLETSLQLIWSWMLWNPPKSRCQKWLRWLQWQEYQPWVEGFMIGFLMGVPAVLFQHIQHNIWKYLQVEICKWGGCVISYAIHNPTCWRESFVGWKGLSVGLSLPYQKYANPTGVYIPLPTAVFSCQHISQGLLDWSDLRQHCT